MSASRSCRRGSPPLVCRGETAVDEPKPLSPVSDPWLASNGDDVAHPNAPRGGGGPGDSKGARPLGLSTDPFDTFPHPTAPDSKKLDPNLLGDKAEELDAVDPQPAPVVTKDETKTINGVAVTIQKDATGGSGTGAKTSIGMDAGEKPEADLDTSGTKIAKVTGPAPKITATILTTYASGASASGKSGYGRGTTDDDKKKGNVTLGFHESCHRQDHQDFIKNHTLPKFGGKAGQTIQEYNDAYDAYVEAVDTYKKLSDTTSFSLTDEVGNPTKSQFDKKP
jgi:hypothetical protein